MKKVPYEESKSELTVLASRFIALLLPIDDIGEAERLLEQKRQDYPKATHYCYAYRLGAMEKMSDDGEPARSVGLPLLELLRHNDIDGALLLVIRYFGGTKLGLGRLARTYREVSEAALKGAIYAVAEPGLMAAVTMPYEAYDAFTNDAKRNEVAVVESDFGEKIRLHLRGGDKILMSLLERHPSVCLEGAPEVCEIRRKIQ